MRGEKYGFTLIELLIVVAIIAILAAIAIPNFLMAQTRAKVARAKGEIRTLGIGLESYYVDNTAWPCDGSETWKAAFGWNYYWYVPNAISTPIAYISSNKMNDPFREAVYGPGADMTYRRYRYCELKDGSLAVAYKALSDQTYYNKIMDAYGQWRLSSAGPDMNYTPDGGGGTPYGVYDINTPYDPSNGTVSKGDIIRSSKHSNNYE
jgi:prepilin-type N-terminal cleavage/methylation domain-containing protein